MSAECTCTLNIQADVTFETFFVHSKTLDQLISSWLNWQIISLQHDWCFDNPLDLSYILSDILWLQLLSVQLFNPLVAELFLYQFLQSFQHDILGFFNASIIQFATDMLCHIFYTCSVFPKHEYSCKQLTLMASRTLFHKLYIYAVSWTSVKFVMVHQLTKKQERLFIGCAFVESFTFVNLLVIPQIRRPTECHTAFSTLVQFFIRTSPLMVSKCVWILETFLTVLGLTRSFTAVHETMTFQPQSMSEFLFTYFALNWTGTRTRLYSSHLKETTRIA